MDMMKKNPAEDKMKYEEMLHALAMEHPELKEEAMNLQAALFDLSQPDIAGDKEMEMEDEDMPMEDEEEGEIEIAVAMPGKKPIPKELMDEEELPKKKQK